MTNLKVSPSHNVPTVESRCWNQPFLFPCSLQLRSVDTFPPGLWSLLRIALWKLSLQCVSPPGLLSVPAVYQTVRTSRVFRSHTSVCLLTRIQHFHSAVSGSALWFQGSCVALASRLCKVLCWQHHRKLNIFKQIVLAVGETCSFHRSTAPNQTRGKSPV